MISKVKLMLISVAVLGALATAQSLYAAPPTGGCSMLTAAQIQKVLGQPFGAPTETKTPPAYAKQSWGSNCSYTSQTGAHMTVTFIVYVDASPAEARQTFDKLAAWYTPKSKPAIGDSAYFDAKGAIHVLKGKTRYYISVEPVNEKQAQDLAASVAAGL